MSLDAAKGRLQELRSVAEQRGQEANRRVIAPAQDRFAEAFSNAPLTTTFSACFIVLSALPILTWIAYSTISALFIFGVALGIALAVIGGALALLIAVLIGTATIAGFATAWIAGLYLAYRTLSNVQRSGSLTDGLSTTAQEVRGLATGSKQRMENDPRVQQVMQKGREAADQGKQTIDQAKHQANEVKDEVDEKSPSLDGANDGAKHEGSG